MTTLAWIIAFSLFGGALSVLAAALFLLFDDAARARALPHFVSFAIGALLGAAFLALLPHALEDFGNRDIHGLGLTVLLGILAFFLLEKLVLWRHCHTEACEGHELAHTDNGQAAGTLILIGDSLHNLVDGALIAAAFLTDIHLGIVTSIAVAAHEIPQEVGDFAILLHSGFTRARAFAYNLLASLATVVGGVLAWLGFSTWQAALPYLLAFAAASFIYVAVADLIPGLHKRVQPRATAQQFSFIVLGVLVIYTSHAALH